MENQQIATLVKDFVENDLLDGDTKVEMETSLFSDGLIDSMNLVQLLLFLEQSFAIKIATSEVNVVNLDTVESIVELVNRLKA